MPEDRKFPRFLPRPGARISITIGEPLTSRIQPLIDDWRNIAEKEVGPVGIGGEWTGGYNEKVVRSKGDLAGGKERNVRITICNLLQDGVRELGDKVEMAEGRFEKGLWSQSRAGIGD